MNPIHTVAQTGTANYHTTIDSRTFQIIADEPTEVGGGNTGMTPMELLASSLASCTTITLRMYVHRKGWDINNIKVEVNVEEQQGDIVFTKIIKLANATISEHDQQKMLLLSQKCPVHKILEKSVTIHSQIQQE